jgi:hypothetical protein
MKYAVETGSSAMVCIPSFMKIGSGIQKLTGGFTDIEIAWRSHMLTFISQNKESRLKICCDKELQLEPVSVTDFHAIEAYSILNLTKV